jgi:hypothetical protein
MRKQGEAREPSLCFLVLHLSKDDDKDSGVKKVLRKINNYFILEPNIAGIGININQIFKDILK